MLGLLTGATRTVALDISKAFDRVWHAGLLHKLKSYGISGQIFGLISSFLSNRRLRVVLDGKSSQEYPLNAGVPQGSILGPTLFLLYINELPDDVICNIAIDADDTTLYSKYNQVSDLWQQLELTSELESDLRDLWTGAGSGLLISMLEKLNYVNSFFPRTARLWNSLPIECFPWTYDLSGFKSRVNRYLLTVGSF